MSTSNVDGQLHKSGIPKEKIIEIHGNLQNWYCTNEKCSEQNNLKFLDKNFRFNIDSQKFPTRDDKIVKCSKCSETLRPGIILFKDVSPIIPTENDMVWAMWKAQMETACDKKNSRKKKLVVIEIGCGMTVPTLRKESHDLLRKYNPN